MELRKVCFFVLLLAVASLVAGQNSSVVVRSGAITLKVSSFSAARIQIADVAAKNGGHVVGGQVRVTPKGKSHGWLRLVVPAGALDSSLLALRGIGVVDGETDKSEDKSLEVQDLASRTQRLQQHQERISGILQSPRHLRGSDLLFFQDRLLRAGLDQDLLGHRREQMLGAANASDISIYLYEPGSLPTHRPIPVTFSEKTAVAFGMAWTSFSKFMEGVGLWLASVLVYALVWLPIAIVIWLLARRFGRPMWRTIAGLGRRSVNPPVPPAA